MAGHDQVIKARALSLLSPMNTILLPFHPPGFRLADSNIHLPDFQLYAVEKWLVDRSRQLTTLVVYTGDPAHTITLSAYSPDSPAIWDSTMTLLRADGAKPKQVRSLNDQLCLRISLTSIFTDPAWHPYGHFFSAFQVGLHHSSYSKWRFSDSQRPSLC